MTGGGLLAIGAASREEGTVRLVGVYGGALSDDMGLRRGIAAYSQRGEGPQPPFRRFDGAAYEGGEMSVYIQIDG